MGLHRLVAEVKLISNLPGETVSGGAGGLLVGGAGGCYLDPTSGSGKSWMPVAFKNGPFHPGVLRGASSLDVEMAFPCLWAFWKGCCASAGSQKQGESGNRLPGGL